MILKPRNLAGPMVGARNPIGGNTVDHSRRRFVRGVAAAGGILASGLGHTVMAGSKQGQPVLSGNSFKLAFGYQPVNYTGKGRLATAINGSVPAPVWCPPTARGSRHCCARCAPAVSAESCRTRCPRMAPRV